VERQKARAQDDSEIEEDEDEDEEDSDQKDVDSDDLDEDVAMSGGLEIAQNQDFVSFA